MLRVLEVVIAAKPQRVSISGGEPLLAHWWRDVVRGLASAGIPVTFFSSGWKMSEAIALELASTVRSVAISIDGADAQTHDFVRGRLGSFDRAIRTLELLEAAKLSRGDAAAEFTVGVDFTVTRSGRRNLEQFVVDLTTRFPKLDFIRFGAVVPEGLAQEESFVANELLSDEQLIELGEAESALQKLSRGVATISVTDARYFLPNSPLSHLSDSIAHIEPDGQLRAVTNYEAKVGNLLEEPLDVLWQRALEWRSSPFVVEQLDSAVSLTEWARATRTLDRRYGSEADKLRIANRSAYVKIPIRPISVDEVDEVVEVD